LAALLEDAVQVMRERHDRLFGVTRLHQPSTAEPLLRRVNACQVAMTRSWPFEQV
jgi:hypothetical protein